MDATNRTAVLGLPLCCLQKIPGLSRTPQHFSRTLL